MDNLNIFSLNLNNSDPISMKTCSSVLDISKTTPLWKYGYEEVARVEPVGLIILNNFSEKKKGNVERVISKMDPTDSTGENLTCNPLLHSNNSKSKGEVGHMAHNMDIEVGPNALNLEEGILVVKKGMCSNISKQHSWTSNKSSSNISKKIFFYPDEESEYQL